MNSTPFRRSRVVARIVPVLPVFIAFALTNVAAAKPGNGKGKGQSPNFEPPGQVDKAVPPGHRRAPVEFIVLKAPPTLRVEVISARPSARHIWVPGYWIWEGSAYAWSPGAWMTPPEPSAVWVTPRMETRSGVSVFISGYWRL